jgi:hypothetical protein
MSEKTESRQVWFPDSNRIGKFNLLSEVLHDGTQRPMLQALFGLCRILEVIDHESGRGKTYIAASDLFQPLAEGEEIPEYRIEMACNMPFEDPKRETARINSGSFGFVAIRNIIVRVPPIQMRINVAAPAIIR